MDFKKLAAELTRDEKRANRMYPDSRGIPTIGIGHNLRDKAIRDDVIDLIFQHDTEDVMADLDRALPWWRRLDEVRQRVVANMVFNLGLTTFLTFHNLISALDKSDWTRAEAEMRSSTWHGQVGIRAIRLENAMLTGVMP